MESYFTKRDLSEFASLLQFDYVMDEENSILDEDEIHLLMSVQNLRYACPRQKVPKSDHWRKLALYDSNYDEDRFRSQFRMSRTAFHEVMKLIENHSAFNETQDDLFLQLGVALFRFGTFGNSSSTHHVATKFGISEGTVHNYTTRVITALTALSPQVIKWPNQQERIQIGSRMATVFFPKCLGFVDGTDVILSDAPLDSKEVYWSRKKHYCMQVQITCDPDKKIRDLYLGFPGSVHDAKVFNTSPLGSNPSKFFSKGEYILGDSAYTLTDTVIVPFRRQAGQLSEDKKSFNFSLSQQRVSVENAIGLLKNRFQSLKGLRVRVDKENGHKRACNWIHACVILHNLLVQTDPWEFENVILCEEMEHGIINEIDNNAGHLRRQALFEIFKVLRK